MKKTGKTLLLCGIMLALLCVSAWAANTPKVCGMMNVTTHSDITATMLDAEDAAVTAEDAFYPLAEKVEVTYSAAEEGKYYAVFLLVGEEAEIPTESNLQYIDQVQAGSDGMTVTVYPNALTKDGTYRIFLSSNATSGIKSLTEVASFTYFEPAPYILGDVNEDEEVDSRDASWVLQYSVEARTFSDVQLLAADVNEDEEVDSRDASWILQCSVELREF